MNRTSSIYDYFSIRPSSVTLTLGLPKQMFQMTGGGGRVVRWCWVNFQCRSVQLIWIRVGQGLIALAIGAGVELFGHFFSRLSFLFSFSLSLGDGPI